ncbi:hypothetical protein [Rickettsia oklahomensis]|uniref:Uncharacterized protein n=1 Tax=Rickettsia oklahomensis TaxID=3141789 RepID=A0AAU7BYP9_9RICK
MLFLHESILFLCRHCLLYGAKNVFGVIPWLDDIKKEKTGFYDQVTV